MWLRPVGGCRDTVALSCSQVGGGSLYSPSDRWSNGCRPSEEWGLVRLGKDGEQ